MVHRLLVALVVAAAALPLAGCLDPFRPVVPSSLWDGPSPHDWTEERKDQSDSGILGPNIVETEYRFDGGAAGPPFPGVLIAFGLRSYPRGDQADLLDRTRDVLDETLEREGVTVDPTQELRGERTLASGARTSWFRLVGTSQTDAPLFAAEEEVRVLGETWYDGRSSTNIIVVALAQTTGTDTGPGGLFGQTVRDHDVWDEIVGDPGGNVGGSIHQAGFIHNLVSHG